MPFQLTMRVMMNDTIIITEHQFSDEFSRYLNDHKEWTHLKYCMIYEDTSHCTWLIYPMYNVSDANLRGCLLYKWYVHIHTNSFINVDGIPELDIMCVIKSDSGWFTKTPTTIVYIQNDDVESKCIVDVNVYNSSLRPHIDSIINFLMKETSVETFDDMCEFIQLEDL